jgi:D-galacturonate reductase
MIDKLNIVVIGSGMYSVGRGTKGFGTIMPAIYEWQRDGGLVEKVVFVSTSGKSSDIVLNKSKKLKARSGIELKIEAYPEKGEDSYNEYKKIISSIPRPACAIICVPDHLHFQVAKDCLNENLPVLMVKPLTPTSSEGRELVNLAKEKNVYAIIEFHKRLDKSNIMMKDIINNNNLGELLYCWVEYSQRKSIPTEAFKEWNEKTSILQYLGIHYIDIIRFATGAIPIKVMAIGQKKWLKYLGYNTYDSIQCTIEWKLPDKGNFTQTILTNWIDPENSSSMSDQKIKIVGTKGRFESDQKNRGITINTDEMGIVQPNPDFCFEYGHVEGEKEWKGYGIDSIKSFLSDLVEINNGTLSLKNISLGKSTFKEALVSTIVVELAHLSLKSNSKWIDINL